MFDDANHTIQRSFIERRLKGSQQGMHFAIHFNDAEDAALKPLLDGIFQGRDSLDISDDSFRRINATNAYYQHFEGQEGGTPNTAENHPLGKWRGGAVLLDGLIADVPSISEGDKPGLRAQLVDMVAESVAAQPQMSGLQPQDRVNAVTEMLDTLKHNGLAQRVELMGIAEKHKTSHALGDVLQAGGVKTTPVSIKLNRSAGTISVS